MPKPPEPTADERREAAAIARAWRALLEQPEAILLSDKTSPEEKARAARELADGLSIKPRKPAARSALMRHAQRAGRRGKQDIAAWMREEILVPAILRAAKDRDTPQPIRIGRLDGDPRSGKWIGGSSKYHVVPDELPMKLAWKWLRQCAQHYAEEFLSPKTRKRKPNIVLALDEGDGAELPADGRFAKLTPEEFDVLRSLSSGQEVVSWRGKEVDAIPVPVVRSLLKKLAD